jgi:hypothetical protein
MPNVEKTELRDEGRLPEYYRAIPEIRSDVSAGET